MLLAILLLLLSSCLSILTFHFGRFYTSMQWIWLPFALIFAYFWALFLIHVLYMGLFSFCVNHSKKKEYRPSRYAMWMLGETCYILGWLFRVRMHATGLGKIPDRKTKIMIVSNHLSGFDHVGLISLFVRHKMICVSKEQNERFIVAGGWIRYAGYLSIKQNDIAFCC